MTRVLIKKRAVEDTHRRGPRENETEIEVLQLRARECQGWGQPPDAGSEAGRESPPGSLERTRTVNTFTLDFWAPGLCENKFLLFLNSHVWDNFLQKAQETHMPPTFVKSQYLSLRNPLSCTASFSSSPPSRTRQPSICCPEVKQKKLLVT